MPIRTESETTEAGGGRRVVSEIRDVSFNVDGQLFKIPLDYLKVEAADFRARIGTKSQ
jgi:hypothetical protein